MTAVTTMEKGHDRYQWVLPLCVLALISIGVVMVASASIAFAEDVYDDRWYFLKRHLVFVFIGAAAALIVCQIPLSAWSNLSWPLLIFALLLLLTVLIPGVGHRVNGSARWLSLGPLTVQPAEVAKFCLLVFFASFLTRRKRQLRHWDSFMVPVVVLGLIALLLLLEPDFGSVVVIVATAMAMMFVAGARLPHTFLLLALAACGLALVALWSPYRLQRLLTFLDPWDVQFAGGYQLTQALIAFGRGEWFGVGLGNSVQKLFYLPEAHTDFIFAILSEEWGLVGGLAVIGLYVGLSWSLLRLMRRALVAQAVFPALLTFGIAVLLAGQAFVNMGVASGLLPTKGLTLPFVSAGGSSLVVCCALFALALRVQRELNRPTGTADRSPGSIKQLLVLNALQPLNGLKREAA